MLRSVAVLFMSLLVTSGCQILRHGIIHPYSKVSVPTFCLYEGTEFSENPNPLPIGKLSIYQTGVFDDERMEWSKWHQQKPVFRGPSQEVWHVEYALKPDEQSVRPFSCITYGKAPPGYKQKAPALPLIPERFYAAMILKKDTETPMSWVYFIIRADSTGHPIKLESGDGSSVTLVITQP